MLFTTHPWLGRDDSTAPKLTMLFSTLKFTYFASLPAKHPGGLWQPNLEKSIPKKQMIGVEIGDPSNGLFQIAPCSWVI